MQTADLTKQLLEEASEGVPPFGARSIDIARQLGSLAPSLLLQHINANGQTAFLALEVLREVDLDAYNAVPAGQRAGIYVSSLENSTYFNAWGVPGYQLTATADALMALGDEAVVRLRPLLNDRRIAPLEGSQEATTGAMHGNRVCDYAWALLCGIRRTPCEYSQSPDDRDRAIQAMRTELHA